MRSHLYISFVEKYSLGITWDQHIKDPCYLNWRKKNK